MHPHPPSSRLATHPACLQQLSPSPEPHQAAPWLLGGLVEPQRAGEGYPGALDCNQHMHTRSRAHTHSCAPNAFPPRVLGSGGGTLRGQQGLLTRELECPGQHGRHGGGPDARACAPPCSVDRAARPCAGQEPCSGRCIGLPVHAPPGPAATHAEWLPVQVSRGMPQGWDR